MSERAPATPEPRYSLTDHNGRDVTHQSFPGKYQLVFFGFTHCREVCPRNLTKLTSVLESLGAFADLLQPLYISVDPERDSPEVMRTFLAERFPSFLGLTGSVAACKSAQDAFRVFAARRVDPDDPKGYSVPHTALTYLLGPHGEYIDHFAEVANVAQIVRRIHAYLS